MPFNIKNVNNNPTGQFKVGGSVAISSGGASVPFQDGTFAHPFLLATDGISVAKQINATTQIGWTALPSHYGVYFKFTMPSLTGTQKLRILNMASSVHPFPDPPSSTLDAYMGIHNTNNGTVVIAEDDDSGAGYAPPGGPNFAGGSSRIDIHADGSANPGGSSSGTFIAGVQYTICCTTYSSNISTGAVLCAAYIVAS